MFPSAFKTPKDVEYQIELVDDKPGMYIVINAYDGEYKYFSTKTTDSIVD